MFRIVIDTREQAEYSFTCQTVRRKLDAGDRQKMQHREQHDDHPNEHQGHRRNQSWVEALARAALGDCGIGDEGCARYKSDGRYDRFKAELHGEP